MYRMLRTSRVRAVNKIVCPTASIKTPKGDFLVVVVTTWGLKNDEIDLNQMLSLKNKKPNSNVRTKPLAKPVPNGVERNSTIVALL
jgi:hypothetical protein